MSCVGVIELRGELGLAEKAFDATLEGAAGAEDLDDGFAMKRDLLGEVDIAEAARADELAEHEVAEHAARELAALAVARAWTCTHLLLLGDDSVLL
jgi:hypothetical protein